jgi:hypothetical protein
MGLLLAHGISEVKLSSIEFTDLQRLHRVQGSGGVTLITVGQQLMQRPEAAATIRLTLIAKFLQLELYAWLANSSVWNYALQVHGHTNRLQYESDVLQKIDVQFTN